MNGNERFSVLGVDGAGRPAAVPQDVSLTQLLNFLSSPVLAAPVSATSNTALAAVGPAWTFPVLAAGVYIFEIYLSVTSNASGGLKLSLSTSTCTAAVLAADTWAYNGTTLAAQGVITSLATALVALTGQVTAVTITGSIIVTAAGNLTLSFAQNASFATPTTINAGSSFSLQRVA